MELKDILSKKLARSKGIPEEFSDRPYIETKDIRGTFTNDEPAVIIRKPKNEKDEATGKWQRVMSKDGQYPIFDDILYMPIIYEGEQRVLITAMKENTSIIMEICGDAELMKGTSFEDPERWEKYTAECIVEGTLKFKKTPKKYGAKGYHDIDVLDSE